MGEVRGVYKGAEIALYNDSNTIQSGNVEGHGTWSYSISWTENGFTDTTWQGGYPFGPYYTPEEVYAMSEGQQYLLAQAIAGMGLGGRGCVTVEQISE